MAQTKLKKPKILSFGSAFPEKVLTNNDLEKMVDTSDAWIRERTGIQERRVVSPGEQNSDIAALACRRALENAKLNPQDVDLLIACTTTPDRTMPSLAATVQAKLGIANESGAFDIVSACAGWVVGLSVAEQYIRTGRYRNVLVVGAEALSRIINWKDRTTCVLFGDGAGACVVTAAEEHEKSELLSVHIHADGRFGDALEIPGGGSQMPTSQEVVDQGLQYIRMKGQEVFKHAVRDMADCCNEALEANGLTATDIDWLIPHQANLRIMDAVARKLNFPTEKVVVNVHKYGNTSSATIPTAADEYVVNGKIKRGDLVLVTTFGGGLSWGSALFRW